MTRMEQERQGIIQLDIVNNETSKTWKDNVEFEKQHEQTVNMHAET